MVCYILFRIEFICNKNMKKIMRMVSAKCNVYPRNPNYYLEIRIKYKPRLCAIKFRL